MKQWKSLAISLVVCAGGLAYAADLYRWVDDQGRTQMSDRVPDKYRDRATKVDSRTYELTEQQRREAQERATRERAQRAILAPPPALPASAPTSAASAPAAAASAAAKEEKAESECDRLWREFTQNQDCFGPYRLATGGLKVEAFDACGQPKLEPSPRCGPKKP